MPKNPQEFADLFGAQIIGEVPDVGGGPFGMARLAHIMHQRLTPSRGERPGRPTDSTWASRPKVPMSEATRQRLEEIAEAMSTPERRVSPMQVAAQLLEEAVARVPTPSEPSGQRNCGGDLNHSGAELRSVTDLLVPGESALAVFTHGQLLSLNPDGTGSSGNWVIDPERRVDRFIVYSRSGPVGMPAGVYRAEFVGAAESAEPGRFVVNFRGVELVGVTRESWPEFADTGVNPVRYITRPPAGRAARSHP
jgi:hypothetical protein